MIQNSEHAIIDFSKSVECTTPVVNPNINYGLQEIKIGLI